MSRLMVFGLLVSILCILYGDAFVCNKLKEKTEIQVERELEGGWALVPVPYVEGDFFYWPMGLPPQNHAYVKPDGYSERAVNVIRRAVLERMNEYRRIHEINVFEINQRLNNSAQEWANKIARQNHVEHTLSSNRIYGENVSGPMKNDAKLANMAVDFWYCELQSFKENMKEEDYENHDKIIGHVTQLLWTSSYEVGVGIAIHDKTGEAFVVVQYYPIGNYPNNFVKNLPTITKDHIDHVAKVLLPYMSFFFKYEYGGEM